MVALSRLTGTQHLRKWQTSPPFSRYLQSHSSWLIKGGARRLGRSY
jgi:hypothetical protein